MKTVLFILFFGFYSDGFGQTMELQEQKTKVLLEFLDSLKQQIDTSYKLLFINADQGQFWHDERLDKFVSDNNLSLEINYERKKYLSPYTDDGVNCIYIDFDDKIHTFHIFAQFYHTINDTNREIIGFMARSNLPTYRFWLYDKKNNILKKRLRAK